MRCSHVCTNVNVMRMFPSLAAVVLLGQRPGALQRHTGGVVAEGSSNPVGLVGLVGKTVTQSPKNSLRCGVAWAASLDNRIMCWSAMLGATRPRARCGHAAASGVKRLQITHIHTKHITDTISGYNLGPRAGQGNWNERMGGSRLFHKAPRPRIEWKIKSKVPTASLALTFPAYFTLSEHLRYNGLQSA